ncbi:MAG: pantetheine-phosphate adenylyltransferase [Lachnospiraceae bacterium]|nr:pantetheine-phosphate adenylyltransferase [Lachnospiraceae bacterium]MDE6232201.1 pantetheine-phosphate adenylyltransferase [Lachnospiraceae bacterium]MDE6252200.1 pantetheine-phosphate adenylyltransferase [Lachnospiraceae bacterium]
MTKAIYPGSFDPVTLGHLDIIKRSSKVVDELVIGVLVNKNKTPTFTIEERLDMIREVIKGLPNVTVRYFEGMTVDFARKNDANIIIRGLRAVTDFESEMQIAQTNHSIEPEVDTMFFTTSLEYAFLSSTIVKEVAFYGGDVSRFVPKNVEEMLKKRYFPNSMQAI